MAAIADAARRVMSERGIRLTQVADVAKAAGVAAGTIYLYAADKNALVELALKSAARHELLDTAGEPQSTDAAALEATAAEAIGSRLVWPQLEQALVEPPTAATLDAVLAEAYDLIARERLLITFLDRCADEVEALHEAYREGARRRYLASFEACLRRLAAAGCVRADLDLAAMARATLEMISWMAMRRPRDSHPPSSDDAAARTTTLALARAGLAHGAERAAEAPQSGSRSQPSP